MTELAVHLTGPVARAALAQRDITAVYRILRDAGVTQSRIAEATGQKQSEVSEILVGRRVHSIRLLERIADGLGVPRGRMGLAYFPTLTPEPAEESEAEEERTANLLRHGATVLFGKPVFGPARPIAAQDNPTPVPGRVGLADVKRVVATTERLSQLAGDLGGIPMTAALTAHTRASDALLGATMSEPVKKELLIALSDAHSEAGGAASDSGLRDLARQHCLQGMDRAGAAGDPLRIVVNLDRLGYMELYAAPNDALKFFQLGAAFAPTGLCRATLEYHCALAHGMLSLEKESLNLLRRARDTYQAASDESRPWPHFATSLPHVEGKTYLVLGHFDRAVAVAASAASEKHAVLCTMSSFALLAAAQLRCGELRSGLSTAERTVSLAKGLRSVTAWDTLAPLQAAAEARRDSACQDLARELATLRSAA
jgi:transcriptional regulator with XRE-family HTH domain